jgi:hypothetical protein
VIPPFHPGWIVDREVGQTPNETAIHGARKTRVDQIGSEGQSRLAKSRELLQILSRHRIVEKRRGRLDVLKLRRNGPQIEHGLGQKRRPGRNAKSQCLFIDDIRQHRGERSKRDVLFAFDGFARSRKA